MNCQNCKHWVFNKCSITGSYITAEKLCNAWELSVSFDQAQKSNSAPENVIELKDTIVRLKGFVNELIESGDKAMNFVEGFCNMHDDTRPDYWHVWKALTKDWKEREE